MGRRFQIQQNTQPAALNPGENASAVLRFGPTKARARTCTEF